MKFESGIPDFTAFSSSQPAALGADGRVAPCSPGEGDCLPPKQSKWSDGEEEQLRELYGRMSTDLVADAIGRTANAVRFRARLLGLDRPQKGKFLEPSEEVWLATAAAEARLAAVPLSHVVGHCRNAAAALARWRAWKALADLQVYSLAGIARSGGFDSTSVLYGLKRLREVEEIAA